MLWQLQETADSVGLHQVEGKGLLSDPNQRALVIFPGALIDNLTCQKQPLKAAKTIKALRIAIEQSLPEGAAMPAIYLYSYDDTENRELPMAHFRQDANKLSHEGIQTKKCAFLPFVLNEGETLGDLTPSLLKARLSRLTYVGHCYGSVAMKEMQKAITLDLRTLGWDQATINDCLKEKVDITLANVALLDAPAAPATQIAFTAMNDTQAIDFIRKHTAQASGWQADAARCGYPETTAAKVPHETTRAVAAASERPIIRPINQGYLIRAILPTESESISQGVEHDMRTFLAYPPTANLLRRVLGNALTREAGSIGDGHQLLSHDPAPLHRYAAGRMQAPEQSNPQAQTPPPR